MAKQIKGGVNNISTQIIPDHPVTPGLPINCIASIGEGVNQVRVTILQYALQSTLQTAYLKGVDVQVEYDDDTPENVVWRITLIDKES